MDATNTAKVARPTKCLASIEGNRTCKRLPMHHGEHRAYLTVRQERKALRLAETRKTTKSAPKVRRLRAAKSRRQVAAPTKVAHVTKTRASGKPVLARPSVG